MTNDFTGGWIKLHRKLTDWEWYTDINVKVVFLHLLLTANFKESRYKGNEIPVGSVLTTADELAQETNLSVWQVRTAIDKLKSTGEIQITRQFRKLMITISKYATYQCIETNETNLPTNEKPIYPPIYNQFTTNLHNNKKEIKKENKERKNVVVVVEESATATATATEIQNIKSSINDYPSETEYLLAQEDWKECVRQKFHAGNIEQVDIYIKAFQVYNVTMGMERHTDERDLKRHFNSWLRMELKRAGK